MLCCCQKLWRFHRPSQECRAWVWCKHLSLCALLLVSLCHVVLIIVLCVIKQEWDRFACKNGVDRTIRENLPFGRSSEVCVIKFIQSHLKVVFFFCKISNTDFHWLEMDLLLTQDMDRRLMKRKERSCGRGIRLNPTQSKASWTFLFLLFFRVPTNLAMSFDFTLTWVLFWSTERNIWRRISWEKKREEGCFDFHMHGLIM